MKTKITLGLAMVSLLLLSAFQRIGSNAAPAAGDEPDAAEACQVVEEILPGAAASSRLLERQPSPPVAPSLLAALEAEADPDRRSEALRRAVESASTRDLPALLDSLMAQPSAVAAEWRQLLIRRWAGNDAPAAAAWASRLAEGPVRRSALKQVAIVWANADVSAAADWVRALPEGDSKQAGTLGFAYEAARTQPVVALELAAVLSPAPERDALLVHAVSQWGGTDFTHAAAWAMQVPDSSLRQRLIAAVAVASAKQDGAAAATLAAQILEGGEEQNCAVVSIVQRWAEKSPQRAATWVAQFPDSPTRGEAVQNLLVRWIAQDADAAGRWVNELPPGSLRDDGMAAYAQALADPAQAAPAAAPAGKL